MKIKAQVRAFAFDQPGEKTTLEITGRERIAHTRESTNSYDSGGGRIRIERGAVELFMFLSEPQLRELRDKLDAAIGVAGITRPCDRSSCYDCNRWPAKPEPKPDPTVTPIHFTTEPSK